MKNFFLIVFYFFALCIYGQDLVVSNSGKIVTVNTDATTTAMGVVQLAGDLSGTATNPTVTNAAVISKLLTGFALVPGKVVATDNVLTAFGKLQSQFDGLLVNVVSGTWTLLPWETKTFTLTLPQENTKYEFAANGTNTNGIIAYSATMVTTKSNMPIFLTRNLWWYYNGYKLIMTKDPLTNSTDAGDNRVVDAVINNSSGASYSYNNFDVKFTIWNNGGETTTVNWKYVY